MISLFSLTASSVPCWITLNLLMVLCLAWTSVGRSDLMIFILLKNLDIPMIYLDSQPGLNRKASNHERASDQSSTVLQQPAGNFGLAAAVCIDGKWSQFPLRSLPVVGPALGLGRAPAQIHPESMLTYCTNLHESARICTNLHDITTATLQNVTNGVSNLTFTSLGCLLQRAGDLFSWPPPSKPE